MNAPNWIEMARVVFSDEKNPRELRVMPGVTGDRLTAYCLQAQRPSGAWESIHNFPRGPEEPVLPEDPDDKARAKHRKDLAEHRKKRCDELLAEAKREIRAAKKQLKPEAKVDTKALEEDSYPKVG